MNDQNRVVVRRGARTLSAEEIDRVNGAAHTLTACTFNFAATTADGDVKIGEC